jgi:hypothetical protein
MGTRVGGTLSNIWVVGFSQNAPKSDQHEMVKPRLLPAFSDYDSISLQANHETTKPTTPNQDSTYLSTT